MRFLPVVAVGFVAACGDGTRFDLTVQESLSLGIVGTTVTTDGVLADRQGCGFPNWPEATDIRLLIVPQSPEGTVVVHFPEVGCAITGQATGSSSLEATAVACVLDPDGGYIGAGITASGFRSLRISLDKGQATFVGWHEWKDQRGDLQRICWSFEGVIESIRPADTEPGHMP